MPQCHDGFVPLPHTYPDMYKVASQNHSLRQFWGSSIPLSVRHKHNSCLLFAQVGSSGHQRTQWIQLLLVECNVLSPQVWDVLKNFHFWCRIEHFYNWAGMLARLKQILAQYFITFFSFLDRCDPRKQRRSSLWSDILRCFLGCGVTSFLHCGLPRGPCGLPQGLMCGSPWGPREQTFSILLDTFFPQLIFNSSSLFNVH